jgi:hypothetical protein
MENSSNSSSSSSSTNSIIHLLHSPQIYIWKYPITLKTLVFYIELTQQISYKIILSIYIKALGTSCAYQSNSCAMKNE